MVIDMTPREDVVEELEEFHGWQPDPDRPGRSWIKRDARWRSIGDGSSVLEVFKGLGELEYDIPFSAAVPHYLIVRACIEATADCWRCGTACEGDCCEPYVTVNGEVV